MTKQTEALKMAIDCLEYHYKHGAWGMDIEGVIVYCKEALAQPAQKPVAYTDEYKNFLEWDINDLCDKAVCNQHEAIPLYTSPQKQWVGLSDDDFKDTSWFTDEFIDTYYANENLQITVCKSDKPQPKEPQHLYVWQNNLHEVTLTTNPPHPLKEYVNINFKCIGKIKLEVDDE